MSIYTGIETNNVTLNLRDNDTFYNRNKYFANYLADVAERIRTGQNILDAEAYPPTRSLSLNPTATTGTWIFAKGNTTIGAISYLKGSDQISFTLSTDDTDVNNTHGQLIDAISGDVVTTFTISNGQFQWTEHISDEAMTALIAQIGSETKRYYFSIVDDDTDERIIASGVAQYTKTMTFRTNPTDNFDSTISSDAVYSRSTTNDRISILEDLINRLEPNWYNALIAGDVSGVPTLDSYIATLLENASSDTRIALNTIFGGNITESIASLFKSHRKVLETMVIEVQAPTSNVFVYNVPLINDADATAPTYRAYIDVGTVKFSSGAVTAAQFAFFYSSVVSGWVIKVLDSGTWKFVKSDGTIVSGNGPFGVPVDPDIIIGSGRLNIGFALGGSVTTSEWFYKVTTAIGGPTSAGGNGRYEIRKLDLTQWMTRSGISGLFTLGAHDDVILSTNVDSTVRSLPIRIDSITNPYTMPITKTISGKIGSMANISNGKAGVAISKNNAVVEGITIASIKANGYKYGSIVPVGTYVVMIEGELHTCPKNNTYVPYGITMDPVVSKGDGADVQVRIYVRNA